MKPVGHGSIRLLQARFLTFIHFVAVKRKNAVMPTIPTKPRQVGLRLYMALGRTTTAERMTVTTIGIVTTIESLDFSPETTLILALFYGLDHSNSKSECFKMRRFLFVCFDNDFLIKRILKVLYLKVQPQLDVCFNDRL